MGLVKWDEIERQIAIESDMNTLRNLHSVLKSKELRKQLDGSIKGINKCERYKIKIEFEFGDHYKNLESENRNPNPLSSQLTRDTPKKQAQRDIDKSRETINKYTRMSNIEDRDELLNDYEVICNDKTKEMSSAGFLKFTREKQYENLPQPKMPKGKYRIIYADPPWKYNDKQETNLLGGVIKHYPTMTINELCNIKLPEIEDNAVLFLWTTSPLLEESFEIINAWGFKYKSSFIWDKIKHNMGHYNSVRHEFLLIAIKGSCQPDVKKLFDSVQTIERTKKHSEKPEKFREIIDTIYPNGNRIELFARNKHDKWDTFGNEI